MKFAAKRTTAYGVATLVAAFLFFAFTNPAKLAPNWIIFGFCLSVAVIYWLARLLVSVLGLYSKSLTKHPKRLIRALTLCAAAVIALQSIGQLTFRDLAILVPLVILGYFYVSYGSRRPLKD